MVQSVFKVTGYIFLVYSTY